VTSERIATVILFLAGCTPAMPQAQTATQGHPPGTTPEFTLVVLPDTQYYAATRPEIFRAQIRWVIGEQATRGIAAVIHEGDIVDANEPRQWARASDSLRLLDGLVPYVLSVGNHDYARAGAFMSRDSLIDAYFSEPAWTATTGLQGRFEASHVENSFQIIDVPAGPWMILSLEFGPRDAALAWGNHILKQYRSIPAILVTHAYLRSDNTRYDHTVGTPGWNPHRYLDDAVAGSVNDGEEIWRKLVVTHSNVLFVLCGHDLGDGVGRLSSVRPDGSRVHQILANYQMGALGGGGYLRLMHFSPASRRVEVQTYSPYLDRFKTDADNAFGLDY
jgi:Calcineurin-like phosphoesterase